MNFNTPEEWKSESVLYPTTVKKDRYNCETLETATDGTVLRLAWRPVTDEATIEEYGIHHKGGIKAALFDVSVSVKLFDIIVYDGGRYEVKGIKKYPSYRLIIAERVGDHEQ